MLQINELQIKIEAVRSELNELAQKIGTMTKEVLLKSEELDELLNEYNQTLKGEKRRSRLFIDE